MSVQYAPSKLKVPAGFQNLLEGLAREVLRDQPDEILKFAAEYFKNQLARRDNTGRDDAVKGDYMEKLAKGENVDVPPQHATPPSDITRDAGTGLILPEKTAETAAVDEKPQTEEEEIDIDLTDPEVEKAAKKIQGVFKGKKPSKASVKAPTPPPAAEPAAEATQEPAPTATESDSSELTEDEAATKIQALARGKKARDDVQAIRDSQTDVAEPSAEAEVPAEVPAEATKEPTEEEKENAAIMIQSAARMKLAKDEVDKIKAEKAEKEEPAAEEPPAAGLTEEEAAVKIQSVARMKAAKEEVEQLKQQQASDKEDAPPAEADVAEAPATSEPTPEEIDAAAIKIQASFRGHQARESIKAMKQEAPVEGEAVPEGDAPVEENAAPAAETEAESAETVIAADEVSAEAEAAPVTEDAPPVVEDTPAATEAKDPAPAAES